VFLGRQPSARRLVSSWLQSCACTQHIYSTSTGTGADATTRLSSARSSAGAPRCTGSPTPRRAPSCQASPSGAAPPPPGLFYIAPPPSPRWCSCWTPPGAPGSSLTRSSAASPAVLCARGRQAVNSSGTPPIESALARPAAAPLEQGVSVGKSDQDRSTCICCCLRVV